MRRKEQAGKRNSFRDDVGGLGVLGIAGRKVQLKRSDTSKSLEEVRECAMWSSREECSRQGEQHVQRPWGQ